jgi:hypothetical protein
MPSIEVNQSYWNGSYDWKAQGDEWSRRFGGAEAQWWSTLHPRIHRFVPADTILEIGPGFGRWSQFLRGFCRELVLVDLSPRCIDACKQRFAGDAAVSCHVNDGRSLRMIADDSVDFVFSFDSLVHVEVDVIREYLAQLASKLRVTGTGFLHHSNLGEYDRYFRFKRRLPGHSAAILQRVGLVDNDGFRAISMTAERFAQLAEEAGLVCIGQEVVSWASRRLIDCFSIITKSRPGERVEQVIVRNAAFTKEMDYTRRLSRLYSGDHRFA